LSVSLRRILCWVRSTVNVVNATPHIFRTGAPKHAE
jgi:hypothetical protein